VDTEAEEVVLDLTMLDELDEACDKVDEAREEVEEPLKDPEPGHLPNKGLHFESQCLDDLPHQPYLCKISIHV
jgi:hypothetical protein